jgi:hypothetical protein
MTSRHTAQTVVGIAFGRPSWPGHLGDTWVTPSRSGDASPPTPIHGTASCALCPGGSADRKSKAESRTLSVPDVIVAMLRTHLATGVLAEGDSDAMVFTDDAGWPVRSSN